MSESLLPSTKITRIDKIWIRNETVTILNEAAKPEKSERTWWRQNSTDQLTGHICLPEPAWSNHGMTLLSLDSQKFPISQRFSSILLGISTPKPARNHSSDLARTWSNMQPTPASHGRLRRYVERRTSFGSHGLARQFADAQKARNF